MRSVKTSQIPLMSGDQGWEPPALGFVWFLLVTFQGITRLTLRDVFVFRPLTVLIILFVGNQSDCGPAETSPFYVTPHPPADHVPHVSSTNYN